MEQPSLDLQLSDTALNTDTVAALKDAGIQYIGQLLRLQHIRQIPALDQPDKTAISVFLQQNCFRLGQELPDWEPPAITAPPRVPPIGPPRNGGAVYRALLIGGVNRGIKQVHEPLSRRGIVVEWHWESEKKRQRRSVKPFPKDCDIILRMADLSATMTNAYKAIAKKEGRIFLSISRKKAQWTMLLDEIGLKERKVTAEELLAEERQKKATAEKIAAAKRLEASAPVKATPVPAKPTAEKIETAAPDKPVKATPVPPKPTAEKIEAAAPDKPVKATPVPAKPTAVFTAPTKPVRDESTSVKTTVGNGYLLEPISKTVADLAARNKMQHAVYTVAQRVDRICGGSFESLLPLIVAAMQREGIRGLMITGAGESIEYTRPTESK